jgi:hypothetical protein
MKTIITTRITVEDGIVVSTTTDIEVCGARQPELPIVDGAYAENEIQDDCSVVEATPQGLLEVQDEVSEPAQIEGATAVEAVEETPTTTDETAVS